MKKLILFFLSALAGLQCLAYEYSPSIYPTPAVARISASDYSLMTSVIIECGESDRAGEWAVSHLNQWYSPFAPEVRIKKLRGGDPGPGAYSLNISDGVVRICAGDLSAVRYALYSLRQIVIPARGTRAVQGWIAPESEIEDRPDMEFRGLHLCWFPETEAWEIERDIRLAAYYKMNYVVIESWGTFRSELFPWLGWPDGKMTKDEIARLRAIADDLGVCLIPQFNVFGHASGSRIKSAKHDVLDFSPEYQPLFEPQGGWNWCLSNPETVKVQTQYISELLEAFGNPPFFHLGCDEAEPPSCPGCIAQDYSKLVVNHISSICSMLADKGVRGMMWHDMLIEEGDPRWNGFYAHGSAETAGACPNLPKNIVICDWYYGGPLDSYPTLEYFKSLGFDVLTAPYDNVDGIYAQGCFARKSGIYGVLGTTWSQNYGEAKTLCIVQLADAMWSTTPCHYRKTNDLRLKSASHLRQIGWDMKATEYTRTGVNNYQVVPENFIGK